MRASDPPLPDRCHNPLLAPPDRRDPQSTSRSYLSASSAGTFGALSDQVERLSLHGGAAIGRMRYRMQRKRGEQRNRSASPGRVKERSLSKDRREVLVVNGGVGGEGAHRAWLTSRQAHRYGL